jgi:hypothetical protein
MPQTVRKKDYPGLGKSIGELLVEKQKAYGDSFSRAGEIMAILYPDGIKPYQVHDALTVVRIIDKMFRIANAPPDGDVMGESPWRDMAGYSLLALERTEWLNEQRMDGGLGNRRGRSDKQGSGSSRGQIAARPGLDGDRIQRRRRSRGKRELRQG